MSPCGGSVGLVSVAAGVRCASVQVVRRQGFAVGVARPRGPGGGGARPWSAGRAGRLVLGGYGPRVRWYAGNGVASGLL